jgi:probable HAF family extracellular repeat protein
LKWSRGSLIAHIASKPRTELTVNRMQMLNIKVLQITSSFLLSANLAWSQAASAVHNAARAHDGEDGRAYVVTDLGTFGGTESFAYAVNNRGDIVGLSRTNGDASTHAFLSRRGSLLDLYPLNSQNVQTVGPSGINNRGQIASGLIVNGIYVAAVFDVETGATTILGSLGGTAFGLFNGVATAINDAGQAVGYSYLDSVNRHAFLYSHGVMTDIGSFGGYSVALDINDEGSVVGFASESVNGFPHAFVYDRGVMREINPFNGPNNESYAESVNNSGQIVGEALNPAGFFHGFVLSTRSDDGDGIDSLERTGRGPDHKHASITDIGTLEGGRNSEAFSINRRGQVVGIADYPYLTECHSNGVVYPCTKYAQHAFLYAAGVMTDLNSLIPAHSGWDLQWAFDINDRGEIVGYGLFHGRVRAYALTLVH